MKVNLLIVFVMITFASFAQTKKKPASARTKTTMQAAPVLNNEYDSLSYAIGMSVAGFYKEQGITNVNTAVVSKAIKDVLKNGRLLLNDQQANTCLISFIQKQKEAKAEPNKKIGESFLAENKTKTGIVSLPSGLQYQVLQEGNGPKPVATDKVKCNYRGTFIDGVEFDGSERHGGPIDFNVSNVIKGWTEALQLMPVGSKWRLFVPSDLGYGDQGSGPIQPGSTLIFEVELLEIVK
ncbi:MAG: FKBP-type peptidyl-prolyl cis-trans isomerase [Bacteroidetes bacterium]|nr:FKBP-type peptidyl-prolyl cis-trans isomerase [Bacteroidota bacterium]MBS1973385.1 FKBP-type peptidyl-prolyl cis-trans isomerase [Bacteroidota bacterium]